MFKLTALALSGLFAANLAWALTPAAPSAEAPKASACETKAVDKNGKPLAGAAKTSFLKKCEADSKPAPDCAAKALSAAGKPLAGAARTASIKKCEAEVGAVK